MVEQRPDQRPHLARVALDLLRLVDAVDQDDDPAVAERLEHALELPEQLVPLLAAGPSPAVGIGWPPSSLGLNQSSSQRRADGSRLRTRSPLRMSRAYHSAARQPPAPVEPAQQDRHEQPREDGHASAASGSSAISARDDQTSSRSRSAGRGGSRAAGSPSAAAAGSSAARSARPSTGRTARPAAAGRGAGRALSAERSDLLGQ